MADFLNQLSQVRIETWITLLILFVIAIAIIYILSIWIYKRAPANMGFIRTGLLGTKICLGRGALVLPARTLGRAEALATRPLPSQPAEPPARAAAED